MHFAPISDEQLKVVPSLQESSISLGARTSALVASLQMYFDLQQVKARTGVVFRPTNDGTRVLADIETPVGGGRLTQAWGADADGMTSIIVVEKAAFDEKDRVAWKVVWGIHVPQYEDPYANVGPASLKIPLNGSFGGGLDQAIFSVGSAVVAAIVTG